MELETLNYAEDKQILQISLGEIMEMQVPVVLEVKKPLERMNGFEKRKYESGRNIREKLFYTDASSGKSYCGGTFLNDFEKEVFWELDPQKNIFTPREGIYATRHYDKLRGIANFYILKGLTFDEFIQDLEKEGIQFNRE